MNSYWTARSESEKGYWRSLICLDGSEAVGGGIQEDGGPEVTKPRVCLDCFGPQCSGCASGNTKGVLRVRSQRGLPQHFMAAEYHHSSRWCGNNAIARCKSCFESWDPRPVRVYRGCCFIYRDIIDMNWSSIHCKLNARACLLYEARVGSRD